MCVYVLESITGHKHKCSLTVGPFEFCFLLFLLPISHHGQTHKCLSLVPLNLYWEQFHPLGIKLGPSDLVGEDPCS